MEPENRRAHEDSTQHQGADDRLDATLPIDSTGTVETDFVQRQ
jgi:hypothetical protein